MLAACAPHIGRFAPRSPIMRRLHVDREDDRAPGKRHPSPQKRLDLRAAIRRQPRWLADLAGSAFIGLMPEPIRVSVAPRILGEAPDPDEITRLLSVEPAVCARKGDAHRTASGREIAARSGAWRLDADTSTPCDLNAQISTLLAKLPNDPSIGHELSRRYQCDVFCGLLMPESNKRAELQPHVLSMLGDRGLGLGLDIDDCLD